MRRGGRSAGRVQEEEGAVWLAVEPRAVLATCTIAIY